MKREHKECFELSVNQKRSWLADRHNFEQLYTQVAVEFPGELSAEKLISILEQVTGMHEALSSGLKPDPGSVFPLQVPYYHKSCAVEVLPEATYAAWIQAKDKEKKNLAPEDMLPLHYYIFSDASGKVLRLVYRVYSFWADPYAALRILEHINALLNGKEIAAPGDENFIIHRNFSAWQNELVNENDNEGAAFWSDYPHDPSKQLLPFGEQQNKEFQPRKMQLFVISAEAYKQLMAQADKDHRSVEHYFLSGMIRFLRTYERSGLTLGYTIFDRNYEVLRNTVGLVSKTVPLEIEETVDLSDGSAVQNLIAGIGKLRDWSDYYGADALDQRPEKLRFKVCFQYIDTRLPLEQQDRKNYLLGDMYSIQETFEIKLTVINYGDRLEAELYYNEAMFNSTELAVIGSQLQGALKEVVPADNIPTGHVGVIPAIMANLDSKDEYNINLDCSVIDLIRGQVQLHPEAIAIRSETGSLSYQKLWERTGAMAEYIVASQGAVAGKAIAVLLDDPAEYMIAVLAILRTGAFFVPLDTNSPGSRISFVLKDCNCAAVITEGAFSASIDFPGKRIHFEQIPLVARTTQPLPAVLSGAAYAIYTSGSSGFPKGVMVAHRSLTNYISWAAKHYLRAGDTGNSGLFTSFSFDLTLTAVFVPLINGKTVFTFSNSLSVDEKLTRIIRQPEINLIKLTPAHIGVLSLLNIQAKGAKVIVCGGEALTHHHVKALVKVVPELRIYNEYGPTETTVGCVVKQVSPSDTRILIGRPISNTSIRIVNENGICPVGSIGEIMIAGAGVAMGYLNKPGETRQAFQVDAVSNEVFYRSGDLARLLSNGELEYIGRKDEQIKIRGYRVELGEIEHHLKDHPDISDAAVICKKEGLNEKELIAFVVSARNLSLAEVRDYLSSVLPDYMLPQQVLKIEKMPLTSNGKVDRKALPDPEGLGLSSGVDYVAPQTEAQKVLVGVWSDVLKREGIGIKDSFFNLGGDSIKSIQVVSRLKQKGYTLKVEHILRTPVLEELALLMQRSSRVSEQSVVEGRVELTPVQHWFFEEPLIREPSYFNQSVLLKSKETLDRELLEKSITALVRHHDVLRMIYRKNNDGSWEQRNRGVEANHYRLDFYDLAASSEPAKDINSLGENLQSGLDLEKGPLFRVVHFRLKDGDRLGLILHHLLVDGVSWRILLEDLSTLYSGYRSGQTAVLPLKTDSFQKWAKLQKEYSGSYSAEKERSYWEKLSDQDILPLPQDKESSASSTVDSSISFHLDKVSTELLQTRVHGAYNTEINDILLTGLGLALQEVFDRDRAVIRMEGHGREEILEDVDISRTVGWFTSMYPFVLDVSNSATQRAALVQVKESLRKLPGKGIGYGILKYLSQEGLKDSLKAEILFNYLGDFGSNVGSAKSDTAIFDYASESLGATSSLRNGNPVLLDISGMLVFGELSLSLRYSRDKYPTERIRTLAIAYEKHLKALIAELSEEKQKRLTPSDLSFKGLSISELSELNADGNLEDVYELSPLQEGIYYHWLTEDSGMFYFEQMSYRVKASDLEIEKLRRAYAGIVSRHGILRTGFSNRYAGRSLQIVRKAVTDQFSYEKLSGKDAQAYINKVKQSDRERGFDLSGDSQMRLHVIELVAGEYEFIWSHHHILMDGWCMSVLIDDFNQLLSAELKGTAAHLPAVVPYSAYIRWLNKLDKASSLAYWKEELSGYKEVAVVPFRNYPEETGYTSGSERLWIEGDLFKKLTSLCSRTGITQNTFIQGVWGYLLSRYNSTTDVVFGSVVSGRPAELEGVEEMIGLFVNTIPVRVRYAPDNTPAELLSHLQDQSIRSTSHHYVNLSEVQSQSEPGMNLINHILIFENYVVKEQSGESVFNSREGGIFIESAESFERTNYDLNIIVLPAAAGLGIDLVYNSRYYDSGLISRLKEHLHNVIRQFAEASDQPLHALHYLTQEEQEELLNGFNATDCAYSDVTVMELFEAQVKRSPDAPALQFGEETLSYGELNARSNVLAHLLRDHYGVSSSDRVGVMLERSPESVICMIGLMKTGACYVPVDHEYPSERVRYITEDSGIKLMISTGKLGSKHGFKPEQLFLIEEHDPGKGNKENPLRTNALSDGSYVIYTSGSTGQPKGVLQTHRMLSNLIQWDIHHSGIAPGLKHLQYASFSFDASLHDLYFVLGSGGSAYIVKESQRLDYPALKAAILNQKIAVLSMPFSALNAFCTETEIEHWQSGDIRYIVSTAEQLYVGQGLRTFLDRHPGVELHNHYGPSESHVISSHRMSSGQSNLEVRSPIGKPLSNSRIYILDGQRHLVPVGVEGELYLGGHNLAIGYLNKEELTQERFVEDPFRSGEQLYKTGDQGYWRKDGTLVFTGRKDDQVKIRGYRIELGEIEHALQSHEEIEEAVVLAKDNPREEKELVAYLRSRKLQNSTELRGYLKQILPEYMLPLHYVQLDSFPLTGNGKIDKRSLPAPKGLGLSSGIEYIAPRTETEKKLVEIWEMVLQKEHIGIKDDFFALGGHSLKMVKIINRINKHFDLHLDLRGIYKESNIEALAELISASQKSAFVQIEKTAPRSSYDISDAQRRLWVLSQFEGGSVAYNIPGNIYLNEEMDIAAFRKAVDATIDRHEILRTVFKADESGAVKQWILQRENLGFKIEHLDFRYDANKQEKVQTYIEKDSYRPFNLAKGPLFRAALLQTGENEYIFYFNMHHIISDGWSLDVLSKDVMAYYTAFKENKAPALRPLKIHYKDYSAWQLAQMQDETFKAHKDYWLSELQGELPLLDLPAIKQRPRIKTQNGQGLSTFIDPDTTRRLRSYSAEHGGSLFISLLAAWKVLMYCYTSQTDIIIGTPVAGREHADLEDQIGCYLNTLALRNEIRPEERFTEFYTRLRENTLKAYSHQVYPFDRLLEDLEVQRDTSRGAVFDILLALQNNGDLFDAPELTAEALDRITDLGYIPSTFDIRISVREVGDYLSMQMVYNPDVYEKEMAEGLIRHYRRLLHELMDKPEARILQLDCLSAEETQELLYTFNNTQAEYPADKTITDLFEKQASETPDRAAVVFNGKELSYRQLQERSTQLAAYLRKNYEIHTGDLVGIQLNRSERLIIVMLGILKAGAAYVPIDPEYPASRKEHIVKDTALKLLITESEFIYDMEYYEGALLAIDVESDHEKDKAEDLPGIQPADLAYVIYTSGSTGRPKGIMITHRNVVNIQAYYNLQACRSTLTCNYVFDVSVLEIFATLLGGGTLYIPERATVSSVELYARFLYENEIAHAYIHPFQVMEIAGLLDGFEENYLNRILIGVDKIEVEKIDWYRKNNIQVLNGYGPSECTVCCTMLPVQSGDTFTGRYIPIGKPIANTRIYILGPQGRLLPKGAAGEICVSGDGLARGYLKQEALTKEKFIAHPFQENALLYKTGDLGRWLPGGIIEFLGRKDDQVKIRGYRVELGEIEYALKAHKDINEAIVLAKSNEEGEKELVAYIIADTDQNSSALGAYLKERLPDYMVPLYYVQLESLPLTPNGKINKKALPEPDRMGLASGAQYIAPRNEIEEKLVEIWEDVLKREKIGVKDDFFALGGHSLKIIKVINQINKHFGLKYDLKGVYTEPTIEFMAEQIRTDVWFKASRVENESDYNEVKI